MQISVWFSAGLTVLSDCGTTFDSALIWVQLMGHDGAVTAELPVLECRVRGCSEPKKWMEMTRKTRLPPLNKAITYQVVGPEWLWRARSSEGPFWIWLLIIESRFWLWIASAWGRNDGRGPLTRDPYSCRVLHACDAHSGGATAECGATSSSHLQSLKRWSGCCWRHFSIWFSTGRAALEHPQKMPLLFVPCSPFRRPALTPGRVCWKGSGDRFLESCSASFVKVSGAAASESEQDASRAAQH